MKLKLSILFFLVFLNSSLFGNHSVTLQILIDIEQRNYNNNCDNYRYLGQLIGNTSYDTTKEHLSQYHNIENIKFSGKINLALRDKTISCSSYGHLTVEKYYIFTFTIDLCENDTIYNPETFTCDAPPPPAPECSENELLNETTNKCDCVAGFARTTEDKCSRDTDGDNVPDIEDPDIDGDGLPNSNDPDIDGDGIPNSVDPTPNGGDDDIPNNHDSSCGGFVTNPLNAFGASYPFNNYMYYGESLLTDCQSLLNKSNIDSILYQSDKSPTCEKRYCFIHETSNDCTYSANNFKPGSNWVYKPGQTEDSCSALVDGEKYLGHSYILPHTIACPNTAYCFLQLKPDNPDSSNSEIEDDSMEAPDLNSTSSDNQPLLQAQNTTNKHLQDLKDKADTTNDKLDDIKNNSNDLKTSNEQIKQSLDKLNLDSKDSMSKQLSELKKSNSNLGNVNDSLKGTNQALKGLTQIELNNNSQLQNIASNARNLNDNLQNGLFGDDPFAGVDIDDGSSTFGDLQGTASDSFGVTTESNIFGLANMAGSSIPTFQVNILNTTVTIFKPSMLNDFPITEIRALILFLFALIGFAQTFRSI